MGDGMMRFDEAAARHNAAYAAFVEMYRSKNPEPVRAPSEHVDWLTLVALVVLVSASVIVSGSRTIIEFGGGLVGASAFVMLELGIVAYGYIRTTKHFDEARHANIKRLTTNGMRIAFGVAVAANIHATLKQNGIILPDLIDLIILLSVAVAAPALAFIAGDVLGMEAVAVRRQRERAELEYAHTLAVWRDGLNAAWHASPLYRSVRITVVQPDEMRADESRLLSASRTPDGQRTDARARVWAHLEQHPEHAAMKVRDLAVLVGVGKTTVSEVMSEWRVQKGLNR